MYQKSGPVPYVLIISILRIRKICYNESGYFMDSVILLNKPAGITSFDAVSKCRRILHERKAGHTGTLDPEAEGLMIILMGRYTKLLPFCVKDHKRYHAEFILGKKTDTEDIWGQVTAEKEPAEHSDEELRIACVPFTGKIKQIPPMYSAIKKDGRKLYEYARKGIEIEREARDAEVSFLEVKKEGDHFTMDAEVSSGTYIRTLISDYCASIGEYGTMTALTRTGIEHLSLEDACTLEDLEKGEGFLKPELVIDPSIPFAETANASYIRNGRAVKENREEPRVLFTENGQMLAVYEKREDGLYHCVRGLW